VPPEDEVEAEPEPETEVDAATAPRNGGGRAALGVAVGAAIVFALLTLAMTVLLVKKSDESSSKDRTEVAERAAAVVVALTSHDPAQPDTGRATIEKYANQAVLGIYDAALEGLTTTLETTGVASRLQIDETYIGDIKRDEVDVALIATVLITPKDGSTRPPLPDQFFRVHLVKLDGEWKVDNVEFARLVSGGASGTGQPPGTSATTSLPPIVTPTTVP
jgi:hypothetical protein